MDSGLYKDAQETIGEHGFIEKAKRHFEEIKSQFGRIAAASLIFTASFGTLEAVQVDTADAETITYGTLGYPNSTMPCEHYPYNIEGSCANYDWGPKHTQVYDDPSQYSPRGYTYRNCTDYTAWKLQSLGVPDSATRGLGNGGQWYDNAPISRRSKVPKAWDAAVVPDTIGHVAFVESVNSDGTITVSEYNHDAMGHGDTRTGTASSMGFTEFVDFGVHPSDQAQSSGYSDGTFLKVNESGAIYRMVGGSPVRQFNWGAIPDFHGSATAISHADLGKLPTYPRDGSFISIAEAGGTGIYEFAGGAPIRQFNWGAIPGYNPQSVVSVNFESLAQLDHMRPKPKDGTFISIAEAGGAGIYEFAGGAPIRQFNWGAIPGFNGATPINFESLAKLDHMNQYPNDGTFISIAEAGGAGIYEFAGGAPLRLFNQGIIPGFNSVVTVNFESLAKLDHMRPNPENGKFLASRETGVVYRTAGGAALKLYNWGSIPEYGNIIWVNQRTIDQHDHLLTTPTNGTILQGVTSNSDWLINNGARSSTTNKSGAVIVDEQTITNFPVQ